MENEAQLLLDDAVSLCEQAGGDPRLLNILRQSRPLALDEEALELAAPSRFAASYLERNRAQVEALLEQAAFAPLALTLTTPAGPRASGGAPSLPTEAGRGATAHTQENAFPASRTRPAAPEPAPTHAGAPETAYAHAPARPKPAAPAAPPLSTGKDPAAVTVTNTLSRDAFRRMMSEMRGEAANPMPGALATSAMRGSMGSGTDSPEPQGASMPINSKFTFATFVYGEENKHAYHSAQRFAAFADEPGQYNSLFIYGSSGLGKTHLLLAIKNYLAENKPAIRVKYANSQAYIDDFINEIARQKTEGRAILREYHDADVLIIDDIQNIIGKQASIEYFFSLMDEFIRENKKIVIASDRAPKKLGMDERLTSRFNAGMLCLVSEPGFEMKYTILKRYYEGIILGGGEGAPGSVDASLLDALQTHEGHLTDEQLRHMADISGNNIRELESFCERCASLSFEREQAGLELTAEDIEKVADEYFDTARKVIHIDTVQSIVEEFYHVSHEELIGPKRSKEIAFARHVAVYLSNSLCDLSSSAIGAQFGGRDHSTVLNSLKVVESKMREDRRVCEDLQQLKNKITLRS